MLIIHIGFGKSLVFLVILMQRSKLTSVLHILTGRSAYSDIQQIDACFFSQSFLKGIVLAVAIGSSVKCCPFYSSFEYPFLLAVY